MIKTRFYTYYAIILVIVFSSCQKESSKFINAVGEYEIYNNGWYEISNILLDGEGLQYVVNGKGYEMISENYSRNRFTVFMENDTLDIRFKIRKRQVTNLIVDDGIRIYHLNRAKQPDRYQIFNRTHLKEDFRQLQNILNRLHPSLHGAMSSRDFNQLCLKAHEAIDTSMTVSSFYNIVGPIVTRLGCGHTAIWMPPGYWDEVKEGLFPLELVFLKDGTAVAKDINRSGIIPHAAQIESINGKPIQGIIQNLKPYISADAFSNGYRRYRLNKRFSYLFALQYGFYDEFEIVYRDPITKMIQSAACNSTTSAKVRRNYRFSPVLKLNFLDSKDLATIRISSFYFIDNNKFTDFIDSAFYELRKRGTRNLILDIRGNDGGCPFCASHLLSYLATESFTYFEKPYGKFADLADPVSIQEMRFRGKLFILIDGGCFSTSGQFCSLLKYHKIGRLIGSETGGAHICNESNKIIQLKNTRLQLKVARSSFGTAVDGFSDDHGIQPDDLIEPAIEEFQRGIDPVLNYAIKLSKESN